MTNEQLTTAVACRTRESAPDADHPIRVGSPASLLAVIPYLLGFQPASSLVVIGTRSPGWRVVLSMRYDLPDPPDPRLTAEITEHAIDVLTSERIETVLAVGYGPGRLVSPLADALRASVPPAGLKVGDILRAEDQRYWSYLCTSPACCPAEGTPFGADDELAAAATPGGGPVLASREQLAATVAPAGGDAAESMRQATCRAKQRAARLLQKHARSRQEAPARRAIAAAGVDAVARTISRYRGSGRAVTADEAAWLTLVIRDLRVRDDAWARMDPEHHQAHLRLWTDLTHRAQPGYVAAPASLLAFVAWQSGNGALANVALDRALADDPDYSMAGLLRQVISSGFPPSMARPPMTPEEVADAYDEQDAHVPGIDASAGGTGPYGIHDRRTSTAPATA